MQVEVIDDYTIKITLDGKDPYFEYNLTFPILSKNFYLEQDFQTTDNAFLEEDKQSGIKNNLDVQEEDTYDLQKELEAKFD